MARRDRRSPTCANGLASPSYSVRNSWPAAVVEAELSSPEVNSPYNDPDSRGYGYPRTQSGRNSSAKGPVVDYTFFV